MKNFIILFLVAYIAGSINFSIILLKLLKKDDPRRHFSGNAGAVNVYRQTNLFLAALVLVVDMGKAIAVSLLAIAFLPLHLVPWIASALLMGNRFPCFHGCEGGKGVANFLGFTASLAPWSTAAALIIWLIIYKISKQPFMGSFAMILILSWGILHACGYQWGPSVAVIAATAFIVINHRKNIMDFIHKNNRGK